jgi:hypothetical protein
VLANKYTLKEMVEALIKTTQNVKHKTLLMTACLSALYARAFFFHYFLLNAFFLVGVLHRLHPTVATLNRKRARRLFS